MSDHETVQVDAVTFEALLDRLENYRSSVTKAVELMRGSYYTSAEVELRRCIIDNSSPL